MAKPNLLTTLQALLKDATYHLILKAPEIQAEMRLRDLLRTHADDLVRLVEAAKANVSQFLGCPEDELSAAEIELRAALTPFAQEPG